MTQSARARMWLLQVPGWAALLDQQEAEYKVKNVTDASGGYAVDKLVMGKSQKYCGCEEAGGRSWCREPGECGQDQLPVLLTLTHLQAGEPRQHLGHIYAESQSLLLQQALIKLLVISPDWGDQMCDRLSKRWVFFLLFFF